MNEFIRSILTRLLNQECDNQLKWKESDVKYGFSGEERDDNVSRIHEFMTENDIPIEPWIH